MVVKKQNRRKRNEIFQKKGKLPPVAVWMLEYDEGTSLKTEVVNWAKSSLLVPIQRGMSSQGDRGIPLKYLFCSVYQFCSLIAPYMPHRSPPSCRCFETCLQAPSRLKAPSPTDILWGWGAGLCCMFRARLNAQTFDTLSITWNWQVVYLLILTKYKFSKRNFTAGCSFRRGRLCCPILGKILKNHMLSLYYVLYCKMN